MWLDHAGSAVSPVPLGFDVEIRFRDGHTMKVFMTSMIRWSHLGQGDDVVSYRIFAKGSE